MQIEVLMKPMFRQNKVTIPIQYNHLVQSAIYHSLDKDLAEFLHKKGYESGNRTFKLFTFSRLQGRYKLDQESQQITFIDQVKLVVCSSLVEFCNSLVNTLVLRGFMMLGQEKLEISHVQIKENKITDTIVLANTLSPIVLYSTLLRPTGEKYTCYHEPGDPGYDKMITENLKKKHYALFKQAVLGDIQIKSKNRLHKSILKYKDFIIIGYSGQIRLEGPVQLLQVAFDCGLGGKNAQGFGCLGY